MTTSSGRSVGRPPHVHSQIRDGRYEPGDEITGGWTLERLLRMNNRFVERLERAVARGLETLPRQAGDGAHRRQELAAQVNGRDSTCAHCGDPFVPIRGNQKYCSERCRQAAYHQRLAPAESP